MTGDIVSLIQDLYSGISVPARAAFIVWIGYLYVYWLIHRLESLHSLVKERDKVHHNHPYVMYLVILLIFLLNYFFREQSISFSDLLPKIELAGGRKQSILPELVGFILLGIGLILAMEARVHLNGYWGGGIFKYSDDNYNGFVQTGLYKIIRHPIYFGQIVMGIGTVLMVNNIYALLLLAAGIFSNVRRAKKEEAHFLELRNEEYQRYLGSSYFMVPWVH